MEQRILGVGFAFISVMLTIFTAVLVKCFEANHDLPTNLLMIRGVMQVTLFGVAVAHGDQVILPSTNREKLLVVTRGFFTGFLFFTNIAALRFLPLGDVFTIFTARSVFCIILPSLIICSANSNRLGKSFDVNKLCLVLVASLGFYLFLSPNSGKAEVQNSAEDSSVKSLAVITEKSLNENTVLIGIVMALINLLLGVPIMFLTKWCAGTSSSVQSFWSGVGGLSVGVVTSFFDRETNIFSGYYSAYEFCLMLVISASFIMITLLQSQATKLIPTPAVNLIRLAQIPVAYLLCPNEVMPDFYSVMGMLFILSSSVVGDWLLYLEERIGYEEIPASPYVDLS